MSSTSNLLQLQRSGRGRGRTSEDLSGRRARRQCSSDRVNSDGTQAPGLLGTLARASPGLQPPAEPGWKLPGRSSGPDSESACKTSGVMAGQAGQAGQLRLRPLAPSRNRTPSHSGTGTSHMMFSKFSKGMFSKFFMKDFEKSVLLLMLNLLDTT